jgi:type I restriction enzyme S subunit
MSSDNSREIPLVKFGDVCKFQGGSGFREEIQGLKSGDFPFIKVSDMEISSNKKYILDANNWIDKKTYIKESIKLFPENSVVFAKVGAALLLNRRRILTRDTAIDNNMMAAIPQNIEFEFLFYLLSNIDFSNFVQSGAVPSVNQSQLSSIEILLPCSKEQEKIAEVLSTIDRAIAQTEAIIAKQQRIKTGLMQDLLTKGIDENGNIRSESTHEFKDSAIGRIPVEWDVKNLSYTLVDINAGKSPECPDIPAIGDEWGVLKVSAVHPLGFREQENKVIINPIYINPNYEIKDGDLLITRANTPELVGLTCLVVDPPSRLLISDKTLRLVVNKSIAMSEFIFYITQMFFVRLQIEINATGSSAGMKNISQQAIKNLQISLPNIKEQNRIINLLISSTNQINITNSNLIKLRHLKTGLMQDLLTGKVRVTNLLKEKEPASL